VHFSVALVRAALHFSRSRISGANTHIPMTAHLKANNTMRVTSWFGTVSNRRAINGQSFKATA
jgi:hypothetical protein